MSSVTRITEAELLGALAASSVDAAPADAKTATEMSLEYGIPDRDVRRALANLKRVGRLVMHPTIREGIDGRRSKVMAYTILPAKKPR